MSKPGQYAAGFGGVLNLPLEIPDKPPWRGLIPSVCMHGFVILAVLVGLPAARSGEDRHTTQTRLVVPLFVPALETVRHVTAQRLSPAFARKDLSLNIQAEPDPLNVRIDMNSVELSFAKDFTNQLPGVVRAYAGVLALIDRQDPAFARYLIEPPDWTVRETLEDISGKVKFEMSPPQEWIVLRSVARRYSLSLDRYRVCALFESSFNHCLQNAIREKARGKSHGEAVAVRSARVAFAVNSPCGIDVLDVSFTPAAVQRP